MDIDLHFMTPVDTYDYLSSTESGMSRNQSSTGRPEEVVHQ